MGYWCKKCHFLLDSTGSIDQLFDLTYKIRCWVCGYENEFDNPLIPPNEHSTFRKYFMLETT